MLEEKIIEIDDKKYIYLESKEKTALPILLLLHGWNDSAKHWKTLFHPLQEDYHLIALNLPGFGGSDDLSKYTIEDYASFVSQFLNHKKIMIPVFLMGHSYGSVLSIHLVRYYGKQFRKVISLNPAIFIGEYAKKPLSKLSEILLRDTLPKEKIIKNLDSHNNMLTKVIPSNIKHNIGVLKRLETTSTAYVETLLSLMNYNIIDDYEYITKPILFIFGAADPFWQGLKKHTKKIIAKDTVVIFGAHSILSINQKQLVHKITQFFVTK